MLRRLKLFGFGALIGMIAIFNNDRMKSNFFEYVDWGDSNSWVINDIEFEFNDTLNTDGIIYSDIIKNKLLKENINTDYLLKVLDGGWVDNSKCRKDTIPKLFVIDNKIKQDELSVHFYFDEKKHIVIVHDFYLNKGISEKSYYSYFAILIIFLIIMIPTFFLLKRMRKEDE